MSLDRLKSIMHEVDAVFKKNGYKFCQPCAEAVREDRWQDHTESDKHNQAICEHSQFDRVSLGASFEKCVRCGAELEQ